MRRSRWVLRGVLAVLVGLCVGVMWPSALTQSLTAQAAETVVNYSCTDPDGSTIDGENNIPLSEYPQPLTYGAVIAHSQDGMFSDLPGADGLKIFEMNFLISSLFQNHIWTKGQGMEIANPIFPDEITPNFYGFDTQAFDSDQFEQDMKKTIDTATSPVEVNYVLPVKVADVSMKITYKMPAGVSIPEELAANADSTTSDTAIKTVTGFDGQTYVDTPHYLIPEIKGYTASAKQIKFDQKAVGSDGNQNVTITYTKNTVATTPSDPKPVKTLFKVYGKQGLYRYQHIDFKKAERLHHYVKKNRMYAPVFDVVGTATSKAGNPRYLLRDGSYITAKKAFVNKLYWQGNQSTLYVTSPKGTNLYQGMPLTNKVRHLKQGSSVQVVKMVKSGYLTRYQLADGTYITGNKQLVSPTNPQKISKVKAKTRINLYRDVNLQHRIKQIAKGQTVIVKGWDYSFGGITGMTGSKRYKVAGGYITANKKLIQMMK